MKRPRKVKSFQFPLESGGASFILDIGGESVPRGRTRRMRTLSHQISYEGVVRRTDRSLDRKRRVDAVDLVEAG